MVEVRLNQYTSRGSSSVTLALAEATDDCHQRRLSVWSDVPPLTFVKSARRVSM